MIGKPTSSPMLPGLPIARAQIEQSHDDPFTPPTIAAKRVNKSVIVDAQELGSRLTWLRDRMQLLERMFREGEAADKREAMWLALHQAITLLEDLKVADAIGSPLHELAMMLLDIKFRGVVHPCLKPSVKNNGDPSAIWVAKANVAVAVEAVYRRTKSYSAAATSIAAKLPELDRIPDRAKTDQTKEAQRQITAERLAERYRAGVEKAYHSESKTLHRALYNNGLNYLNAAGEDAQALAKIADEAVDIARTYLRSLPSK